MQREVAPGAIAKTKFTSFPSLPGSSLAGNESKSILRLMARSR